MIGEKRDLAFFANVSPTSGLATRAAPNATTRNLLRRTLTMLSPSRRKYDKRPAGSNGCRRRHL
jgi:hypothetical protein